MNEKRRDENRVLDLDSLKGLAHPLRVQILDTLSTYGSFTASGLADRLGESSGATSYHLRQLERHGFVREDAERGTGRERWWERVPGGVELRSEVVGDTPSGRAAAKLVEREWSVARNRLLADFNDRGDSELSPEWIAASASNTVNVRMTAAELGAATAAWEEFSSTYLEPYRRGHRPGTRPVQVHFNAFPVMDGEEIPAENTSADDTTTEISEGR